jgi:hypothetical protein
MAIYSIGDLNRRELMKMTAGLGAPGVRPVGPQSANLNQLIGTAARDSVSGTASHRSYLCEIRPAT